MHQLPFHGRRWDNDLCIRGHIVNWCELLFSDGWWRCPVCGFKTRKPRGRKACVPRDPEQKSTPRECLAGCWLTKLLKEMGQSYSPTCHCEAMAATMDANGEEWCRIHIDHPLSVMRSEAEKRKLVFVESQARWLVELAITLSEEKREPTRFERIRLRAMRLGNRFVNGLPCTD